MAVNRTKLGTEMGNAMAGTMNSVPKPSRGEAHAAMRKQAKANITGLRELIDHVDLNDERILQLIEDVQNLKNSSGNNNK